MKNRLIILTISLIPILMITGILIPPNPDPVAESLPDYNRYWTRKVKLIDRKNGIVIGDSRTYRGVDPETLIEVTGIDFLNFGFSSGGLNPEVYVEAGKRLTVRETNRYILIGVTPWSLTSQSAKNQQLRSEKARTPGESIDRVYTGWYLRFFRPVSPSLIKDHLTGKKNHLPEYYHQVYHDNGWVESDLTPADQGKHLASSRASFQQNRVDENLVRELGEQVKRWRDDGIRVLAFRPPTSIELRDIEDSLSGFDESLIRDLIHASGGQYIDLNFAEFFSYDGSHLSSASARKLSRYLGQKLISSPDSL
jgi:hypothetical protein